MRLGLPGLLLLCALQLPCPAASYGCSYESLKSTGAMCYMRFHCGTPNAKTNTQMLYLCPTFASRSIRFLIDFPVCCLHPVIRRDRKYKSICQHLSKYTVNDGGCDPAAHEVVKVDVDKRPPTTTARPARQHRPANLPTWVLSWCPKQSASIVSRWPQCCYSPTFYRRNKKRCAWMRNYKRRKRDVSESELITQWIAEDEGMEEVPAEEWGELEEGETEIPKMQDAKIEVKCCGSGETKSCRGAECFYICDDSDTAVDTLDITSTDDLCNPEIIGEDTTGRRKKRGYSPATMASWKINWCPRYVTKNRGRWIKWYKICCFHPSVRKHPWNKNGAEGGVANWCHGKSKVFAAWTG